MSKGNKYRGKVPKKRIPVPKKPPKIEAPKNKYGRKNRRQLKVNLRNVNYKDELNEENNSTSSANADDR